MGQTKNSLKSIDRLINLLNIDEVNKKLEFVNSK
jgi:hypothetical protein